MICAQFVTLTDGTQVLSPTAVQPADLSTCAAVVLTGQETGAVALTAFPSQTDAAAAVAFGITLVVVCYAAARGAGAVVNFIR